MKRILILFLKFVLCAVALGALAVCAGSLPDMLGHEVAKSPKTAWVIYLFLACVYLVFALFLTGLYQGFRLLTHLGESDGGLQPSIKALRTIKRCAMAIGGLIVTGVAVVMVLAHNKEDDPAGFVALGFLGTLMSGIVAAAAVVFQRRLE